MSPRRRRSRRRCARAATSARCSLRTPEQGLAELRAGGLGDAISAAGENPLPSLLIVTPKGDESLLAASLQRLPEADLVQHDAQWRDRLDGWLRFGTRVALVLGTLLGLGALLVVGNTVRLDIQSRREEIGVLQHLGATDGFIRRPFLYLGAWYGLAAGALAIGLLTLAALALRQPLAELAARYGSQFWLTGFDPLTAAAVVTRDDRPGMARRRPGRRPLPAPDAPDGVLMDAHDLRHVVSDAPRIMVVDGSKLVRKLIGDVLRRELPNVEVVACGGLAEAAAALAAGPVDLVTTSLLLPDGDGLALARTVRETGSQRYVPVIVVSGDVQARLENRSLSDDVTDYFDKALGHSALAAFIRGYVQPSRCRAHACCSSRTAASWPPPPNACSSATACRCSISSTSRARSNTCTARWEPTTSAPT